MSDDDDDDPRLPNIGREWSLIGIVISQFNAIELTMTKILSTYIQPKDERVNFVERNVFNNSIISFAGKIKLIAAFAKIENLRGIDTNTFHRLLAVRNAIAHNDILFETQD